MIKSKRSGQLESLSYKEPMAIALVVVLLFSATGQAFAIAVGESTTSESRKEISGRYVQADAGLQIDFPEGWSGYEEHVGSTTMAFVTPGMTVQADGKVSSFVMMGVLVADTSEMMSGKISDTLSGGGISAPDCDMPPSLTIIKLSDMKAFEIVMTCKIPKIDVTAKVLMEFLATKEKGVVLMYLAAPDSAYQGSIEKYEESLKTLELKGTIDFSDLSVYAHLLGLMVSKETVRVRGSSYDIAIASNSTITEFVFSERTDQILFKLDGKDESYGYTVLDLGKVLKAPYTVTFDGSTISDYIIVEDKTTGEIRVEIAYMNGSHEITIRGTGVAT